MRSAVVRSPCDRYPMAELTAATPGTSGGDRPVGHWGWENFFLLESVAATLVATRRTIFSGPFSACTMSSCREFIVLSSLSVTSQFTTRFLLYEQVCVLPSEKGRDDIYDRSACTIHKLYLISIHNNQSNRIYCFSCSYRAAS